MLTPADSLATSALTADSLQPRVSKESIQSNQSIQSKEAIESFQSFQSIQSTDSPAAAPVDLLHTNVLESIEIPAHDGVPATPLPYTFRSDDIVTALLLLSSFFLAYVVTASRHYLLERVKNFFQAVPDVADRAEHTGDEMRGRFFILLTLSFCSAILYYDFLVDRGMRELSAVSPYIPLGCVTAALLLFLLLKLVLYRFVNSVFFSTNKREQWFDDFHLVTLFTAVTLLSLTLLVVFFDLSFNAQRTASLVIFSLTFLLLLYRCFRTFCGGILDTLHIFLYFCTLEMIPALVMWRLLFLGSTNLAVILQ